jgi:hypothetical protein
MRQIILCAGLLLASVVQQAQASSSLFWNTTTQKHYIVRNAANGAEAEPEALENCKKEAKKGQLCKNVYTTDSGGYGAIAIGDKSNGYIYGSPTQELADKVALRNCGYKSNPATCRISSRWLDKGRSLTDAEYAVAMAEWRAKQKSRTRKALRV